jgi:hypothetical protein
VTRSAAARARLPADTHAGRGHRILGLQAAPFTPRTGDMVSPTTGWTDDGGSSWTDGTPGGAGRHALLSLEAVGARCGVVAVSATAKPTAPAPMFFTTTHGTSWRWPCLTAPDRRGSLASGVHQPAAHPGGCPRVGQRHHRLCRDQRQPRGHLGNGRRRGTVALGRPLMHRVEGARPRPAVLPRRRSVKWVGCDPLSARA